MDKIAIIITLVAVMLASPAVSSAVGPQHNRRNAKEVKSAARRDTDQGITNVAITQPARQLYGEWNMFLLHGKEIFTPQRAYIYLDFNAHKVYGSNGCNDLNATFTLSDDKISFDNFVTTERSCAGQTSERDIMKVLRDVKKYNVTRQGRIEYMHLMNTKGKVMMVLRRQNLDFLNGAWRVKAINGNALSTGNARLVIDVDQNTIHGNSGCNIINGIITIDPSKDFAIEFEDLQSDSSPCPDIDMESNLLLALECAETARPDGKNEVVFYDNENNEVLRLEHIHLR